MTHKKILIVDDSIVLLKALSMKLRNHGYDVLTAVDSPGAITTVRREKPDLILLDIDFPADSWDGFVMLSWLRRMDEGKDIPVIVITGGDSKNKERCLAAGAVGFFLKPLDHDGLLDAIRKTIKEETSTTPTPSGKKILFVDDENDWRYMASMYLTDSGYEVLAAKDSAEALAHADKGKPDLIILDLNLGGENGLALMMSLKAKHPDVRILLYTGMEHGEAAVQSMLEQGAQRYVRKSTMGDMLQAVQNALAVGADKPPPGQQSQPAGSDTAERNPRLVLIVEDNVSLGGAVELFLESKAFEVVRVGTGEEGVRQIMASDFDIVVCDMVLPAITGEQFYLAVEQVKPHLCKRFIFMTGHQADPRTDNFIRRIRGLMLWKPFPMTDLLTAIGIVWKKCQARPASARLELRAR